MDPPGRPGGWVLDAGTSPSCRQDAPLRGVGGGPALERPGAGAGAPLPPAGPFREPPGCSATRACLAAPYRAPLSQLLACLAATVLASSFLARLPVGGRAWACSKASGGDAPGPHA